MKVVFWSPNRGKGSTTSNMLAIASNIAFNGRLKSCVISTDCKSRLQSAFITKESEEMLLHSATGFGMSALLRDAKGDLLSEENLKDAALELSSRFSLYISPADSDPKIAEKSLIKHYDQLMEAIDKYYPLVFIDTKGGYTTFNQTILAKADLIVICLNQDRTMCNDLFDDCDFEDQKCMFLMGNYDPKINCSTSNLIKSHKEVTHKNVAAIPHCADFADAMNSGVLFKWMSTIQKCKSIHPAYKFHRGVLDAAKKMLTLLDVSEK